MTTHTRTANTELIIRYYDGCSAGDLDELRATLHPDVVHYFLAPNPGSAPVAGPDRSRPPALGCSVPATIRCLTA